ncbi:hypothetical protein Mosig_00062 [Pelagibacter phage Mosig EXVC030M]|nr:hypothetical protein Mosig_00062 [Pelagibacter phage Mosig EXVC030M]
MADLRDFTGKNPQFTGTDGAKMPSGTTGQRVDTSAVLRFNSTTNLMEYYSGTDWKAIDAPPVITSFTIDGGSDVTSGAVNIDSSSNITIEVKGSLFDTTGANVTFIGSGETLSPSTITRNSANLLTCVINNQSFDTGNQPYTIKVTNGSGLSAELVDAITTDNAPVFTNAADTNANIFDSARSSGTIAAADLCGATDANSDTITYSVQSGSLPGGCTLNTATGDITYSSVSSVGTDTVSTFTIRAATTLANTDRQFTITVKAPVVSTFNSPGTFNQATSSVNVLMVAGGGGAGDSNGTAGGGAGGLIYRPGLPITPGSPYSLTVGSGGNGGNEGQKGQNSTGFGLTAVGGGRAGKEGGSQSGQPGGSGGGGVRGGGGGSAQQPGQPGDSGNYGFGNSGGANVSDGCPHYSGGGGGGAGGSGGQGTGSIPGGIGGTGRNYSISGTSVGYAGGGGGGPYNGGPGIGGQANRGASSYGGGHGGMTNNGAANRGGGAGGGPGAVGGPYPDGGSGIVVVQF